MVLMQPRANVSFLLVMVLLCAAAVQAQPYTGYVKVDSIEAVAGTSFNVAVRLQNNNVPFFHDHGSAQVLSSVSDA